MAKTKAPQITFKGKFLNLRFETYMSNKRTAIEAYYRNGQYAQCVTANLPYDYVGDDEIAIKDYSENQGMLQAMLDAGIVLEPSRYIESGFVKIPVCTLLIKP